MIVCYSSTIVVINIDIDQSSMQTICLNYSTIVYIVVV